MNSQYKGVVYFGNKRKNTKKGYKINDFVIPDNEEPVYGRLFMIYYGIEDYNYYLRDLGIGKGVYAKLDYSYKLTSDILVNIGSSHLYFRISFSDSSYPNLLLTVFGRSTQNYCFYAQEQHINPIKIGRADDCDICIDDMLLSKYQACILYSQSKGWMLIDGNLVKQRPSTNGAW
jgi:FHA domain